jgi:Tol biopolymer transport system component
LRFLERKNLFCHFLEFFGAQKFILPFFGSTKLRFNFQNHQLKGVLINMSTIRLRLFIGLVCLCPIGAIAAGPQLNEPLKDHREVHLRHVQQLTFGGENAEAYFSFDGKQLVYQSTPREAQQPCDQIFVMNRDGSDKRLLSTGKGRTTCSFFYPDGKHILYASTHEGLSDCPPPPNMRQGYVWALYPEYDIYKADISGQVVQNLTSSPGYDAEAVLSPRGDKIVFTSLRSGDLELWTMDLDGANLQQLTHTPGYDGGAFFSPDGSKIVWRASRFDNDPRGLADYQALLKKGLIRPNDLELFVMNADGTEQRQITDLGKASFGPYFHPSGEKILFSSNLYDPKGREFDLFLINVDGSGLQRITYTDQFDGFPMFSLDGQKLVWGSNRHNASHNETNVFIADWVEDVREIVPEVAHYRQTSAIKAQELFHHVRFLADDRLMGRYPGSEGIEYAAHYIADRFAEYGLEPIAERDRYFQPFDFIGDVELGNNNRLQIKNGTTVKTLNLKTDYVPLAFSDSDEVTGEVIFAGYGISSTHYDDYANLNVQDKIVLMLRATPPSDNPHQTLQRYASLRHKLVVAREKGAKAVLFVTGTAQDKTLNELVKFQTDFDFKGSGIAAVSISRAVANQLLANTAVQNIGDLQKTIDEGSQPNSFALPDVQVSLKTDVKNIHINTRNIVGYLPGKTNKTLIIGAHYDHIGLGGNQSLDSKEGVIHNGADDNASGVAGLLELAQYFGSQAEPLTHSLLFLAFSAEEFGLIGSKYYVNNPLKPLDKTVAMLNLDMIGHSRSNQLIVQGVGTTGIWSEMLDQINSIYGFELTKKKDGPGPSDQASFYYKNLPVLAFFTGAHEYYNRSSDDFWRINYPAQARIVKLVRDVVLEIEKRGEDLPFTQAESERHAKGRSEFKVTLGVVPDYAFSGEGLHLDVVKTGRPAHKAGLQNGDIIIQLGTVKINNIYDYMAALGMFKPDDKLELVFKRKGKVLKTDILLAE